MVIQIATKTNILIIIKIQNNFFKECSKRVKVFFSNIKQFYITHLIGITPKEEE